jgi:hypothetical protein
MKSRLWKGMLAATIALPALSGVARAQSTDNDGCTNATLKGDYAFSVVDFILPQVVVGIGRFDGKGGYTQVDYIGDSLRTIGATSFSGGETGSYTVNPDCTGKPRDQVERVRRPRRHLTRGYREHVCDQRWRPLHPRRRC